MADRRPRLLSPCAGDRAHRSVNAPGGLTPERRGHVVISVAYDGLARQPVDQIVLPAAEAIALATEILAEAQVALRRAAELPPEARP